MQSLDIMSTTYSDSSEEVVLSSDSLVSSKHLPLGTSPVLAVLYGEANGDWNNIILKVS